MPLNGVIQGLQAEFLAHMLRCAPADDFLGADILHGRQIQCPFGGIHLCNVRHPYGSGLCNVELLVQKVFCNGQIMIRIGEADSEWLFANAVKPIAEIHGCTDKLLIIKPNPEEVLAEEIAQEIDTESIERASNFSFSKCQIPVGATIEYAYDESLRATVIDERNVEYSGETMSLTALAKILSGKQYSIAGPKFFKYKGEWLFSTIQSFLLVCVFFYS